MEKIKFSVLMSVYKYDEMGAVKEAIDSLLSQTLLPDQIVIVVDGPIKDDMHTLLNVYEKNEMIDIYYRNHNLGLGLTLNEGLNYCKYDYVARMDADDFSYPTRFEKQIAYIKDNPDIDLVGTNIVEYSSDMKTSLAQRKVPKNDIEIKAFLKSRNAINHVTVLYKKESVLKAGSYEDCPYFEDYYLWCKMAKKGSVFYNIQESLVKVRAGEEMAKRRGGLSYCKHIIHFEKKIKQIGFIGYSDYAKNSIVRIVVSLLPSAVRESFYKRKLREK